MDFSSSLITPVILCGGFTVDPSHGSERPKPFRKLSGNLSRFQQTLLRVSDPGQFNPPMIVADEANRSLIDFEMEMIGAGRSGLVLEPMGRGTAPSLATAALVAGAYDFTGSLLVIPCDHLVRDPGALIAAIDRGEAAASTGAMVAFGRMAKPGDEVHAWIQKGAHLNENTPEEEIEADVYRMERFIPKSEEKDADALLEVGEFYRSSGMYLFPIASVLKELMVHAPEVLAACQKAIISADTQDNVLVPNKDEFAACPEVSIDRALMQKTSRGALVPTSALWSEDGQRPYLPREIIEPKVEAAHPDQLEFKLPEIKHVEPKHRQAEPESSEAQEPTAAEVAGNVILREASNAHVETSGPLTVVAGLDDVVVVNSGDAVIVSAKSHVAGLLQDQDMPFGDAASTEVDEEADAKRAILVTALDMLREVAKGEPEQAVNDEAVAEVSEDTDTPVASDANEPLEEDTPAEENADEEPPLLMHAAMVSAA